MSIEPSPLLEEIRASGRPIVVSVSGGKDSTAMALYIKEHRLAETNPVYHVFADTGWEHPELMEYIETYLNERVFDNDLNIAMSTKYPNGMVDLVHGRAMFPGRTKRFCTEELKIVPIRDFIKTVKAKHPDLEKPLNAVGIRAAESESRSRLMEFEPGSKLGGLKLCDTWRPLITATLADIIDIHSRHGVRPCPLYLRDEMPAKRVGCWPCIMSRKEEIKTVALTDPGKIDQIRELEASVSKAAIAKAEAKGEEPDPDKVWSFFQAKDGEADGWPIDKVVQWSKTKRGGVQFEFELFIPSNESERGCQMWGLCDLPDPETA